MASSRDTLRLEEQNAWLEYLAIVREQAGGARYDEVEDWAWHRLQTRLRVVARKRRQLAPARG